MKDAKKQLLDMNINGLGQERLGKSFGSRLQSCGRLWNGNRSEYSRCNCRCWTIKGGKEKQ